MGEHQIPRIGSTQQTTDAAQKTGYMIHMATIHGAPIDQGIANLQLESVIAVHNTLHELIPAHLVNPNQNATEEQT